MFNKEKLRKKYFLIRKKKYFEIKPSFFNPLVKLIKKKKYKKKINLSSYYPSSFEVNVLKLHESNIKNKIKIFLPVLRRNNLMSFHQWKSKDVLKVNKHGMLEPFIQINKTTTNIMLVPLLAFDSKKNRLGYGKGYYDRYLQKYLNKYKNILTIGIAFSFQKHHKLPVTNNDVKLNYILTEKGFQ